MLPVSSLLRDTPALGSHEAIGAELPRGSAGTGASMGGTRCHGCAPLRGGIAQLGGAAGGRSWRSPCRVAGAHASPPPSSVCFPHTSPGGKAMLHAVRGPARIARRRAGAFAKRREDGQRGALAVRAALADDADADADASFDAAVQEAKEVLVEAEAMAQQQTRAELEEMMWEATVATDEEAAAASASNDDRLRAIWLEHGATVREAEALVADAPSAGAFATPKNLERKLSRLARVLPGAKLGKMAAKDIRVLLFSTEDIVRTLVSLLAHWSADTAIRMLEEEPRLITELRSTGGTQPTSDDAMPSLAEFLAEAFEALRGLGGSDASEEACVFALAEEPSLIISLPPLNDGLLAWKSRDIAELPMSVQNSISWSLRSKYAT